MLALYMDGRFDFDNYTFRLLKLSELFCILMSLEDHVRIGGRLLRGVSDGKQYNRQDRKGEYIEQQLHKRYGT